MTMFLDRCPFCEHVNPQGARFCNACGSPLHLRPCAHCEAVNDVLAEACHRCGVPIVPPREAPSADAPVAHSLVDMESAISSISAALERDAIVLARAGRVEIETSAPARVETGTQAPARIEPTLAIPMAVEPAAVEIERDSGSAGETAQHEPAAHARYGGTGPRLMRVVVAGLVGVVFVAGALYLWRGMDTPHRAGAAATTSTPVPTPSSTPAAEPAAPPFPSGEVSAAPPSAPADAPPRAQADTPPGARSLNSEEVTAAPKVDAPVSGTPSLIPRARRVSPQDAAATDRVVRREIGAPPMPSR